MSGAGAGATGDGAAEARMQRFINGFMQGVPHLAMLGIRYRAHGDRWAELELPYADRLVAYPESGVIASGAIFSLMDSASGFSVFVARGRMDPHATLDLRCDYLRPATPGASVVGRAECFKITRQVAFVRGLAHDGDAERPVAHVIGTFMFTGQR
jgi:uncharacterized protein (TIGR00369 family)